MSKQIKSTLKGWFKTGLRPTQQQYWDWMDSYRHLDDTIPMATIDGLVDALNTISLGTSAVTSVFGRIGTITAQSGDYDFTKISGSVAPAQLPSAVVLGGGNTYGALLSIGTNDAQPLSFRVNNAEQFRINTAGNTLFGTSTDNGIDKVQVNGSIFSKSFRSIASGIGSGANTHWLAQRTEGVQTWSLLCGTQGDGITARYVQLTANNATSLLITAPSIVLSGSVNTVSAISLGSTASDFVKFNNTDFVFQQQANAGGMIKGFRFMSDKSYTGRPSPATQPIFQIDSEGRAQVGDGNVNYGAALNVQSSYGAFICPRLTTVQRDEIDGVHDIVVTANGLGYSSTGLTVTITGGGGTGATAVANVINNAVISVIPTAKGKGYTSAPDILISGGGGTGATAVAHAGKLEAGMIIFNKTVNKHQGYDGTTWNDLY